VRWCSVSARSDAGAPTTPVRDLAEHDVHGREGGQWNAEQRQKQPSTAISAGTARFRLNSAAEVR
jgi:hypothetical protein